MSDLGLQTMQRLLELLNRQNNPLSVDELREFIERPRGPVIAERCVSVHRKASTIMDLHVDGDGAYCYVTEENGLYESHFRGVTYSFAQLVDVQKKIIDVQVEILGINKDGIPVVRYESVRQSAVIGFAPEHLLRVFVGEKTVINTIIGAEAVVNMLTDDSIIVSECCYNSPVAVDDKTFQVWRFFPGKSEANEVLVEPVPNKHYRKFVMLPSGTIYAVYNTFVQGRTYSMREVVKQGEGHFSLEEEYMDDIFLHEGKLGKVSLIDRGGYSCRVWIISEDSSSLERVFNLCGLYSDMKYPNSYLRCCTYLPWKGIVYIGDAKHGHVCWSLPDSEEQPAFEHVSPLFEKDGIWMYYGSIGRHLFLMELPI
ncbi:hypothetical protein HQ571_06665 [Candidatus Kuenenbacteria bacterium]|nr:hypothetical protein [Candidatus Kuenenbacteria bacterium]